ncbi:UbiA family prenyltransferase [Pseudoduganella violaceinigra]|uniref:UbiA family prenyltransferase n=1 Tax=Pseudoduganella violaceinigra TaxID=246602 RepID=UPI00040E7A4F|nr:UbiA family prenyltransferase [Pseudoduganella violaceinigra]
MNTLPLIIDLDGTLIHTDMLHESALRALRDNPVEVLRIPYFLARGKAVLKRRLAQGSDFDAASLPYNQALLEWLRQQRRDGRKLILCTASDLSIANAIAGHLGVFDEVMASDGVRNLSGENKAAALVARFGQAGYDYAGNSQADLPVWRSARRAVVVNAPAGVARRAAGCCEIERAFAAPPAGFSAWRRVFRVHQWLKNLLLLVPLFASHQFADPAHWLPLLLAFIAFSLCASSVYIANDLLDLESDRQHPRKRNRPFASGQVAAWLGVLCAPLLLLASAAVAWQVGDAFCAWLAAYFALTCAYSWGLKRLLLVDCLALAVLYTLRIVAGAAALDMPLSPWLLAFSAFLFLSLAFVKRYAELQVQALHGKQKAHGRGYYTTDAPLIQMLGVGAGYAALVVLALYLNSAAVQMLYRTPEFVWGAVVVMLFWVSWMWMQAHRGLMHDDPLVFAVKDKASLLAGACFAAVLALGTAGWPW